MRKSEAFEVGRDNTFRITHETTPSGDLRIRLEGPLLMRRGELFDAFIASLERLTDLAATEKVTHVHCHLENLGESVSRAQHAMYRMLNSMREQGNEITIHTTDARPESAEHQKMSRLFVEGLLKRPGPAIRVLQLEESQ